MPGDRRGGRGISVDCYCRLEKYGAIPHQVSLRTRYRHMAEAERLEAQEVAQPAQAMDLDNQSNQSGSNIGDDHPQKFGGDIGPQLEENGFNIHDQDVYEHSDSGPPDDEPDPGKDWADIDTPPRIPSPEPPRTPPPESDDDLAHVTAEDYREYDRWFGEDQEDLDEIVLEMLGEEEMDTVKMNAIRLFGHISEGNYERI